MSTDAGTTADTTAGPTPLAVAVCLPAVIRWAWPAFLLVVVPFLLFASYTVNRYEQSAQLENEASATVRHVAAELSRLQTVLSALSAMHYADDSDDGSGMLSLAEKLRERSPMILSIGRYDHVPVAERGDFVAGMTEKGLYDFRIHDLHESGRIVPAPLRELAWPISLLEPMSPSRLALLGADLAAVPGLSEALTSANAHARTHLIVPPSGWAGAGRLMLFQPVYRGLHVPPEEAERRQHADGGYWLLVDAAPIVASSDDSIDRFAVSLSVESPMTSRSTPWQRQAAREQGALSQLYRAHELEQRWRFGDARLVLSLSGHIGVGRRLASITAALLLLSAIALAAALGAARQRRRRVLEGERDRAALFVEREKAERTLDAISDAVIAVDADGRVQHVNPAAERLLGVTSGDAIGRHFDALLPLELADDPAQPFDLQTLIASLAEGAQAGFDLHLQSDPDPDRSLHARLSRAQPLDTNAIEPNRPTAILVLRDNSEERRLTRELEHQANHDALTGCTNRRFFEKYLERLLREQPSRARRCALLYLDLDQFKIVNDTAGHAAGDRLLVELTADLTVMLRHGDVLSRLGGDEFGLIMSDVDRAQAREIGERVYQLFQSRVFVHEGRAFAVRASLGLVHFEESSESTGDVLAAADIACYAAKENGRNELYEYRAADETMAMRSNELNWLPRLQQALERNEFRLHAQPLADAAPSGTDGELRIRHFEFLLRLADDDGREITPWQIIQAAERYGLMRAIDRWVIARALGEAARAHADGFTDAGFSINLSGQSAADPSLIDFIEEQFALHDIAPEHIWFELTETAAISHFAIAVELTEGIRKLGAKVALDDFGSGLSSFGYLKNLPVDVLKIDGQFVKDIASNPIDRAMVRAIAQVARAMGIRTVAEFVEDAESVSLLCDIGIDLLQGYHIGRPGPLREVLPMAGCDERMPRAA